MTISKEILDKFAKQSARIAALEGRVKALETPTPAPTPIPTPPPEPPPANALFRDDSSAPDPIAKYGAWVGARKDGAKNRSTYTLGEVATGHLLHHTAGGSSNGPYREYNAVPGDDPWSANARDALGESNSSSSPVALYKEGQRRKTRIRLRIPTLNTLAPWCELFEIKQCQPYPSGQKADDGVMFELQQNRGKLQWMWHWTTMWELSAQANHWYEFVVDGLYTRDASKAWLDLTVDGTTKHFTGRPTLLGLDNGGTVTSFLETGPYLSSSGGWSKFGFDVELVEVS